jgi:uroporphyrinogen-III synthase
MLLLIEAAKQWRGNMNVPVTIDTLAEWLKGKMMAKMTLIIRPQPDADRDVALLMRYGVPALASPSMKIMHQTHELPESVNFSGIILTSRNAVKAITKFDKVNADTGRWAKLPAFVVGPATAAAARDAGYSNIIRGTGGGAGLLAPISCYFAEKIGKQENGKSSNTNLPLFWPSAVETSFDMVAALATHGVSVHRLPVYQMIANAGLDSTITDKITEGAIAAVVAMSPRSVQIFRRNLNAAGKASSLAGMVLIAGSSAIAAAAGGGWQTVYTARQPRRGRLLAIAVLSHRHNNLSMSHGDHA